MGEALSVGVRERVMAAIEFGLSRRKAAEQFGVGVTSSIHWTSFSARLIAAGELISKRSAAWWMYESCSTAPPRGNICEVTAMRASTGPMNKLAP